MKDEILFKETQRFRQWWLWLILIVSFAVPFFSLLKKGLEQHQTFQESLKLNNTNVLLIPILVFVLIFSFRLDTEISKDQIQVRFFPFHLKFKTYPSNTISLAYVATYNPIADYGGWGLRLGLFGKGKAYNVSGDKGIQLIFKDGSKLLIGTQKPEEASEALQKAGYLKAEVY